MSGTCLLIEADPWTRSVSVLPAPRRVDHPVPQTPLLRQRPISRMINCRQVAKHSIGQKGKAECESGESSLGKLSADLRHSIPRPPVAVCGRPCSLKIKRRSTRCGLEAPTAHARGQAESRLIVRPPIRTKVVLATIFRAQCA
jgi:hypothetical protein